MALKRISSVSFLADSAADLLSIERPSMGMECYVIEDACSYRCTSDARWIKQIVPTSAAAEVDLSQYATKDDV